MHPIHTFPPYFPIDHSNIILLSTPKCSERPLPFRFSDPNFVCISHLSMHATGSFPTEYTDKIKVVSKGKGIAWKEVRIIYLLPCKYKFSLIFVRNK
jgi:hypothetical protein